MAYIISECIYNDIYHFWNQTFKRGKLTIQQGLVHSDPPQDQRGGKVDGGRQNVRKGMEMVNNRMHSLVQYL